MCGDMADWTIENGLLTDWEEGEPTVQTIRCRYCGKRYLHWSMDENNKWRLFDDKQKMHSCENYFDSTLLWKHPQVR